LTGKDSGAKLHLS